jgi:DNA oxidative demethylase
MTASPHEIASDRPRGGGDAAEPLAPGAALLRGFAAADVPRLLEALRGVHEAAPPRRMVTPGDRRMSVAMTNCGEVGWITDAAGYRYVRSDPATGRRWPAMPGPFRDLAAGAAERCGYPGFDPDACLVNEYQPGARLSLHRDADERDTTQPIVSVSLGLPATFLFGGARRDERPRRLRLESGDVVVWGGPARLFFHGVEPLDEGVDPLAGRRRINLTFRRAL